MQLILHFLNSFKDFVKASLLSLVIIAIIYLLMTNMAQGLTMIVEMMESENLAFLMTLFYINMLGLMLSHYPVYTYYAADLNDSGDYFIWKRHNMFGKFMKWFPIYTFERNPNPTRTKTYSIDYNVNYLRYVIGFLVYAAWAQILITSYRPNLLFYDHNVTAITIVTHASSALPFLIYRYFHKRLRKLEDEQERGKILRNLTLMYLTSVIIASSMIILLCTTNAFSLWGLYLLLGLNFFMLINFVFFRLLRRRFGEAMKYVSEQNNWLAHACLATIKPLEKSENYLRLFMAGFIISLSVIIYCIIASVNGYWLMNGLPILLAYLYCYAYIIASLTKFFFVARRMNRENTPGEGFRSTAYKTAFWSLALIATLYILHFVPPFEEVRTHELTQLNARNVEAVQSDEFIEDLLNRGDTIFFIASHGGGLKANVWTLNVMYQLDKMTGGRILEQSAAMSGASGGSLGLALYTALSGSCKGNFNQVYYDEMRKKINAISKENYTSVDLTMMLGPDFFRKMVPLNMWGGSKDRAYYSMVRYQNFVDGKNRGDNMILSEVPFRQFWKNVYQKRNGRFPSLIMNTAATNGQRGISWSLETENFDWVFPNSQNLGDLLRNGDTNTLTFYQAVSMTNRFPIFSPAAKVKGYGHYIDAGAIDNSGLLGCLDFYQYMLRDERYRERLAKKTIVFVEIVNSRSIYIRYLIETFEAMQGRSLEMNEYESPSIVSDIKTGINLDKISDYLSYYLQESARKDPKREHIRILLPHRVSVEDIQKFVSGEFSDKTYAELDAFLKVQKAEIHEALKDKKGAFFTPWKCLEPELSRHFSKSNLNYVGAIMRHDSIQKKFNAIVNYTDSKKR